MDLSKYYAEICKEPFIDEDEERALFTEFGDNNTTELRKSQIRDQIIRSNLRFAFKEAKKYSRNDMGMFPELIGAANEGLIVGFDKYNFDSGVKYLSYAGWWVMQRILKHMTDMRIVSLPIWKQQLAQKIQKLIDGNEKITLAEVKEIFKDTGIKNKDIEELFNTRYLTYYIDDLSEDEFQIDPIQEQVQKNMDDKTVWQAVNRLPSPHREIIAKCFGLEDGTEHTPAKISKAMKVPKEDIQQLKKEGLVMLRAELKLK